MTPQKEQRKLDDRSWVEPAHLEQIPFCIEGLCEELD